MIKDFTKEEDHNIATWGRARGNQSSKIKMIKDFTKEEDHNIATWGRALPTEIHMIRQ